MSAPRLSTAGGELSGRRFAESDTEAFLAIPYAAAPSGDGRWSPPRPAAPWTGVREATAPAPPCPQPARPFSAWAHGPLPPTQEDSLMLNVWRPVGAATAGGRPILVFLHGGGWALGWGANPLLDGRQLAAALDAVVVTLNYRLGSLGWLWHPALADTAGAAQGNWGLLDQLAALGWVAEHAAALGGDASRVTLAGESAGAGSVLHLLGHPAAQGLFQRVVAQSPPLHELVIDADRGAEWTVALCEHFNLGSDVGAAVTALRERSPEEIVSAQEELLAGAFRGTRGGAMPILDPASLPADPAQRPDAAPSVPMLIGTNAREGTFFFRAGGRRLDPPVPELERMVARLAHTDDAPGMIADTRERLAADGEPTTANDILCAVVTEAWFEGPVRRYVQARAAAGAELYRYRIDHPSAEAGLGAVHSISVPLVFGSWREGGVAARLAGAGPATAAVTAAMDADWKDFVHGEPMGWEPVPAVPHGSLQGAVYGGVGGGRAVRPLEASGGGGVLA